MLFYSYAELIIGLVAIFYFTSKIFSITKYKLYFVLSLIFIISIEVILWTFQFKKNLATAFATIVKSSD